MSTSTLSVILAVSLLLAATLVQGADWNDFSGTCLHPASVPSNSVLVFTSPAKVLKAIARYEQDQLGGTCGQEFAEAFARLKWVLDSAVLGDICGLEAYERIRAFHLEFVHFYVPELTREQLSNRAKGKQTGEPNESGHSELSLNKPNERQFKLKPIPKALRHFFINFAKQATAHCKQKLIERLEPLQSDESLVSERDFQIITKHQKDSMRLSFLYDLTKADKSSYTHERISEFNRLEIVDYGRQASNSQRFNTIKAKEQSDADVQKDKLHDDGDDGSKLYIQVPFGDQLKSAKEACRNRFMPIYMELFAPVIRLNNLGYIDRMNSNREDQELAEQEQISRWVLIIQTCEVLRDIEVVHDDSTKSALFDIIRAKSSLAAQNQQRQRKHNGNSGAPMLGDGIKLLSRKEAEQLKAASKHDRIMALYSPPLSRIEHTPCEYTEIMWRRKPDEVERQVKEFDQDVSRIISRKTNLLIVLKRDFMFELRRALTVGKRQIIERDEESQLGRLVVFIERHQNLIRGFGLVMSIIMMCVALHG